MEYSMKIRFIFASGYSIEEYPSIGINIFMKSPLAGRTFIMVLQHGTKSVTKRRWIGRIDVEGTATQGGRNDTRYVF